MCKTPLLKNIADFFYENKPSIIWVDSLSVSAIWKILRLGLCGPDIEVRFLKKSQHGWRAFQLLRFLHILHGIAHKVEYSMGDMHLENGESLQYEFYRTSSETTVAVVEGFRRLSVYNKLASFLPQDKLDFYLEKHIYNEISPLIRLLSVVRWYSRNGEGSRRHVIIWPEAEETIIYSKKGGCQITVHACAQRFRR